MSQEDLDKVQKKLADSRESIDSLKRKVKQLDQRMARTSRKKNNNSKGRSSSKG